jgi:hypothetical protein
MIDVRPCTPESISHSSSLRKKNTRRLSTISLSVTNFAQGPDLLNTAMRFVFAVLVRENRFVRPTSYAMQEASDDESHTGCVRTKLREEEVRQPAQQMLSAKLHSLFQRARFSCRPLLRLILNTWTQSTLDSCLTSLASFNPQNGPYPLGIRDPFGTISSFNFTKLKMGSRARLSLAMIAYHHIKAWLPNHRLRTPLAIKACLLR